MTSMLKMRMFSSIDFHLKSIFLFRLTVNDVEEGPSCDLTNINHSGQSTPIEQHLPQHYTVALRSNPITTNQASGSSSIVIQPDMLSNEPITLSVLSADIDDIVQHAFETWKNENISANNQTNINETMTFANEEDFLLADLLERSENEQQNMILRSIGKKKLFNSK